MLAGVPRLNTPPLLPSTTVTTDREKTIVAPKPIRISEKIVTDLEDLSLPWTRSPTKSKMDPVLAIWQFVSSDPPLTDSVVTGKNIRRVRNLFISFGRY